jgi:DNA-3-methyladenine glycosylase
MKLLPRFYQRPDVSRIARDLLGKGLFTCVDGRISGGMIVEVEAYSWRERGCHAFDKRKTPRNAVMFEPGGCTYVYLCYGMHHLFNIVTNGPDNPEAVLIRAVEPLTGELIMAERRGPLRSRYQLTSGPGKLSRALGIDRSLNGKSLQDGEVWVEDLGKAVTPRKIVAGKRIGVEFAGNDAKLPWRFWIKDNPWVS